MTSLELEDKKTETHCNIEEKRQMIWIRGVQKELGLAGHIKQLCLL